MKGAKRAILPLVFAVLLIIAAIRIAPYFFDVNKKIKPIIVGLLEKNLNAQVKMGEVSLSFYGKLNFFTESLKITKDEISVDVSDLNLMMPYAVLWKNPSEWAKNIKIKVQASEISVNERALVLTRFKTDFLKEDSVVKLKNTDFKAFEGSGKSYLEMDFSNIPKIIFDFEIKNGKWPVEKIKSSLEKKASKIPRAQEMISNLEIDDTFESLKGVLRSQNGITNIESLSMEIPESKTSATASGTIGAKNTLKLYGNIILPLDNVPSELRVADGRGKIPVEVLGTLDNPLINWEKTIELVVHAYTKDEGKKIIKKEVNKLKEKLMKDEKIRELIKGIKF